MGPARQFNRPLPFSFRFLFLTANRLPAESRHSQRFSYSSSVFRRRHRRRGRQEVITRRNANSSNRVVTAVSSNQKRKREAGKSKKENRRWKKRPRSVTSVRSFLSELVDSSSCVVSFASTKSRIESREAVNNRKRERKIAQ